MRQTSSSKALLRFFMIVALCTVGWAVSQCGDNSQVHQIQTGIIEYTNLNKRQNCQDVTVRFSGATSSGARLQSVASIVQIDTYSSFSNNVEYSIKTSHQNQTAGTIAIELIINEKLSWTKISVSYLVTMRKDLILGSFLVDSSEYTLPCLKEGGQSSSTVRFTAEGVVHDWANLRNSKFPSYTSHKVIAFLTGIKSNQQSVRSVQVTGGKFATDTGIVSADIELSQDVQLEHLQISYIVISSEFPFVNNYDKLSIMDALTVYSFNHATTISSSKPVEIQWSIQPSDWQLECVGSSCPVMSNSNNGLRSNTDARCCQKRACVSDLKGILYQNRCFLCESDEIWNSASGKCEAKCREDFQEWNGYKCVCQTNTISVKDKCYKCPANSSPNSAQTDCFCNAKFIWSDYDNRCISHNCRNNQNPVVTSSGVNCECQDGMYKVNDDCLYLPSCPTNSKFSYTSRQCECNDPSQMVSNGRCVSRCLSSEAWISALSRCVSTSCIANSKAVVTSSGVTCQCISGYEMTGGRCIEVRISNPTCLANQQWNSSKRACECKAGYVEFGGKCTQVCGRNEEWRDSTGKCECISTAIRYQGVCHVCPANAEPNPMGDSCVCSRNYEWDYDLNRCAIPSCPANSARSDDNNQCVCNRGYLMINRECQPISQCPSNSNWDKSTMSCKCNNPNQNFINGVCSDCPSGQNWNSAQCSCSCPYGQSFQNGKCVECPINQVHDGNKCVCNLGFYADPSNSQNCLACDPSCGYCSGPRENQCTTCADIILTLTSRNTCRITTDCPKGLFLKGNSCTPCSTYCAACESENSCDTCISGFEMEQLQYGNISASFCVQTCGDGRRFELECDDGNQVNNDGCSSDCKTEKGWTCTGGSSVQKSNCVRGTPDRTVLELTGSVHMYGKIVQGVRLSYLPANLTENDCAECYDLLWVRVIRSDIVPGLRVNYLPKSKYQFLVELEFQGTFAIPIFTIAVQINPKYADYFNRMDMAQIQIKTIDPATLAINDQEDELTFGDIQTDKKNIAVSNNIVDQIFSV